jgi:hypothetical protein
MLEEEPSSTSSRARLVRRCVADWHAINILPRRIQAAKKHSLRKVHCAGPSMTIPLTIPMPVLRELKAQISQVPRQGDTSGQSSWLTRRRGKSGNRRTRWLAPARIEPRFPLEEDAVGAPQPAAAACSTHVEEDEVCRQQESSGADQLRSAPRQSRFERGRRDATLLRSRLAFSEVS